MDYSSLIKIINNASYNILNDPLQLSIAFFVSIFVIILLLYALIRATRSEENLKYEFVTIIAHKFRTPLTHVRWSIDNMISTEQDHYRKQSLEEIQQSNKKLIQLTSTLIELADSNKRTKSSYQLERINLCQAVYEQGEIMKDFFHEKNLYFSVQCTEEEIFVLADKNRIEFVLQAVMENAGIYSPPGRNIEITVYREGKKARVSVTDHGIGMDQFDIMRLFSKFFRAKNAKAMDTEGFGVGLFLSQSIMKKHHGDIKARSAGINQGSTFTISFPLAKIQTKK